MSKFKIAIFGVILVTLMASLGFASDKSKSEVRTITGCLSQGDSAKEFVLTGSDGSTWEIKNNDTVNLTEHVGHTVTATGVVSNSTMHNMKEDSKDMASDAGVKKNNTEHGHLKVTDVKMVSDSCSR